MFFTTRRVMCSGLTSSRRKWEQRVSSVLSQQKEREFDHVAQRYEKLYVRKDFTPVEKAFPLMDTPRWSGIVGSVPGSPSSAKGGESVPSNSPPQSDMALPLSRQPTNPHALNVTFLGPPNAGKSSLVNALALSHVSAESSRRGTTVDWVKAVTSVHDTQLTLLDTPGLMQPSTSTDKRQAVEASRAAWESIFAAELVVLVLPAGLGFLDREFKAIAKEVSFRATRRELPLVLAISKMDKVQTSTHKQLYFSLRTDIESLGLQVARTMETSTKDSSGLVELKDVLCTYAKPRPWSHYFHETSDLNDAQRAHELVRQACIEALPHIIPHKMRHRIIGWTKNPRDGVTEIAVEVFFDRPAFMFTFYGKLHALTDRARSLVEQALKKKCRITMQAFLTPSGISDRSK